MAHALSLNELLCDKTMVDKEDIVRAGDFTCVNLKKMIKEGLPEDVEKDAEAEVQKDTDNFNKKVDEILAAKEKEIMTV